MNGKHHQYIERDSGRVREERVVGDAAARILYADFPPGTNGLARLFSGEWATRVAAYAYFDAPIRSGGVEAFVRDLSIDKKELLEPVSMLGTRRRMFCREIRYEAVRPMSGDSSAVVSPADCKMLFGKLTDDSPIFVKRRFFDTETLLGSPVEAHRFSGGAWAVFRLAPADYHYFHAPVSGRVSAIRDLEGKYFSVNHTALRSVEQVLSSNRRTALLMDTDVDGGTSVGTVAVVAVAAQVIGRIVMGYSACGYDDPVRVGEGLFVEKGQPLGLFEPGSSTVVVLFEEGRIDWCPDLPILRDRPGVGTRYHAAVFGRDMNEVQVRVRDTVAFAAGRMPERDVPLGGGRVLKRSGVGWHVERSGEPI